MKWMSVKGFLFFVVICGRITKLNTIGAGPSSYPAVPLVLYIVVVLYKRPSACLMIVLKLRLHSCMVLYCMLNRHCSGEYVSVTTRGPKGHTLRVMTLQGPCSGQGLRFLTQLSAFIMSADVVL